MTVPGVYSKPSVGYGLGDVERHIGSSRCGRMNLVWAPLRVRLRMLDSFVPDRTAPVSRGGGDDACSPPASTSLQERFFVGRSVGATAGAGWRQRWPG